MDALMDTNIRAIEATGAKKIVFSCPGCYRMFWQEYSKVLGKRVRMMHEIELIDELVKSGKIKFNGKLQERMTYHDPCELSRLSGVIDEPRNIIADIAKGFVELPNNKFNVACCGGGGLYKSVDTDSSIGIAGERIAQAEQVGATILATACPSCIMTLGQAARSRKSKVKVIDFAEAVAQQIE